MPDYAPPFRDIRFVLERVVDLQGLAKLEAYHHADPDTCFGIIEEAGRFLAEVFGPLNRIGDQVGSILDHAGNVVTPPGFRQAYQAYVDAGWGAVPFEPAFGGGGFPWVVAVVIQEILTSANMAFSLCPLLNQGAIDMLTRFGTPEQQATFLEKMIAGVWTGTMNLTEPEAGSDVGALRTKAVPSGGGDGSWRITGQKIFITFGDHDLADNIIHLVLARIPGAPPGTKGISCFIVPKHLVNPDGSLGERNDVRCVSIEHKLGIHASPTCVMSYGDNGGAVGYLVGEANAGMRYMFHMMNVARLSVGLEGLAIAERAYQASRLYAQQRRQGRAVGAPATVSSPIVEHPDVRRMLLTMKAQTEAMRCLLYTNAAAMDRARHGADADERQASQELVDLLTPICKGWCTDVGVSVTSLAIQVHGGMGYVEETGVAQYYRDSRIAPIYEGTNGIQAIDLVMRKLPLRGGGVVKSLLGDMDSVVGELAEAGPDLDPIRVGLGNGIEVLRQASAWLLGRVASEPNDALAGATPYLELFGLVAGGWLLARSALAAHRQLAANAGGGADDEEFLAAKVATARFFCQQLLPGTAGLVPAVTAGAAGLYQIDLESATLG
ncbi:MAG: 3-(methylsulfanyl)propanoyl-CoA dehydrogenase [Acidimicrobiaceae bacterium]|nr:3-(methylsulfanyl)propanoyl-CoA dehydrogenase [Acidimicrobiaceae bacterium]